MNSDKFMRCCIDWVSQFGRQEATPRWRNTSAIDRPGRPNPTMITAWLGGFPA